MLKAIHNNKLRASLLLCLSGLLSFSAVNVRAQGNPADQPPADQADQVAPDDSQDPPSRVARISYLDGSVSLQPGGQGDWGSAQRNRPMTVGDRLWTDKDSRAELQTGVVSIHLGSMTALSFLNLDQSITQMRLAEGSINFRVKEIREGDTYEVDTPNLSFIIKQAGAFRIDVNENGDNTGITVIRGEGQVTASGKTYDLHPGERGIFNGTDDVQSTVAPQAPPADGLDKWSSDRDLGEQNSVSSRYVAPDMPGTSDLDNNGTWGQDGDNGPIWYPAEVSPDWAPYSNGYWSYVGPWGWTWVDYAPWGFAPFHYGRWGFVGGRWGWYPGPRVGFSIYGPACVGFLGGGFGFGFGVGFGVGWFPLGFGEPFHPWFHAGFGFRERINVHNTFIRNVNVIRGNNFNYAFAHNTRAVTATSRGAFTGGQAINRGAAHINEASLREARVTNNLGVSPSRQSAFGAANLRGNIARPSSSVENRSVMARTAPGSGASHIPVRSANPGGFSANRSGSFSGNNSARQTELSRNRPPATNNMRTFNGNPNNGGVNNQRATNNSRSWEAQGNASDRGHPPQGFGSSSNSGNSSATTARGNRPPWAGSGAAGATNNDSRSYGGRTYTPPQGNGSNTSRTYSAPSRSSANPAPTRSYSAPSSRTYSAPSRSYGGGGGGSRPSGGGGSAPHASGGGGGGGGHPHR